MGSSKNGQHKLHGQSASPTTRVQVLLQRCPTGADRKQNVTKSSSSARMRYLYLSHQPIRNEDLLHISKQRRACPLSAINDSMILPVSIANSHVHTTR